MNQRRAFKHDDCEDAFESTDNQDFYEVIVDNILLLDALNRIKNNLATPLQCDSADRLPESEQNIAEGKNNT